MLIQNKTDLINYLRKELKDEFIVVSVLDKLRGVKDKYHISDNDPYELEVYEIYDMEPARYSIHIRKVITKALATMIINVNGD